MSNSDSKNVWTQIQAGVREAERLMGQKQYNQSMIKSRETLDFMLQCLVPNQNLETSDLNEIINELYHQKVISKNTCDNYQKIRIIGDKAIRDNDNNAYNAHIAHTLLSQEVFAFSNDQTPKRRTGRSISRGNANTKSSAALKTGSQDSSKSSSAASLSKKAESIGISTDKIIKIAAPVLVLIILILIVRACTRGGGEHKETSTTPVTVATSSNAAQSSVSEPLAPSTVPQTPAASSSAPSTRVYKTNSSLRVRATPSTTGEVITVLPAGTTVEYVRAHDNEWAVINYNNRQVYVASRYLTAQ